MAWSVKDVNPNHEEDGLELIDCEPDDYRGPLAGERIKTFRSLQWGDEHGLILDKKGRLWGCGRTNFGILGQ